MVPYVIIVLISLVGGTASSLYLSKRSSKKSEPDKSFGSSPESKQPTDTAFSGPILLEARTQAKEIVVEAKDQALKIKQEAEETTRRLKEQFSETERSILVSKSQLEAKEKELENRTRVLKQAKDLIDQKEEQIEKLLQEQKDKLEKVSGLTRDEARRDLLGSFEKELAGEKGKRIREMEEEIKRTAEVKAQEILLDAMKYGATDYVVEHTTSKVKLPEEDLKSRIIGKEGRNIERFEELTGVELELDGAPGEVIVSCFDPVRREIAKISLERLITDGRIQPARIEEIVEKTQKEVEHIMFKEGDNLCHRVGVYNLPNDIIQMLGRFKYRFSYGQNLIEHTLEETRIGVAIANELKVDVETVKLGCLLHDIGKVITDEEGTHVQLGVELLKKYNISEKVINTVAEHHEDRPFSSIESGVVALADHISGARPGARHEDYESYAKRMKNLEEAASSFDGVDKVYAISAGREVRVFVNPTQVDDASTAYLAREIAKKIELELTYPGVVKVTVIREKRVSETAK